MRYCEKCIFICEVQYQDNVLIEVLWANREEVLISLFENLRGNLTDEVTFELDFEENMSLLGMASKEKFGWSWGDNAQFPEAETYVRISGKC